VSPNRRLLAPDARPFFEKAGYTIHAPTNESTRARGFIVIESFEVGRLYERLRGSLPTRADEALIVDVLRAVRTDREFLAALESAWLLGGAVALVRAVRPRLEP
jgi:hypothetical protein